MLTTRNSYAMPVVHGDPPGTHYGIADAAMLKIQPGGFIVHQDEGGEHVHIIYDGGSAAAAITLADYNGCPTGTIIHDLQVHKTHEKTGAATWVSSAARA